MKLSVFKNKSVRFLLFPLLILLLALIFSGKNASKPASWDYARISGKIISEEGLPLKDCRVLIYNNVTKIPDYPLASSITKSNGSFKCKVFKNDYYIVEVQGSSGSGRLLVSSEKANTNFEISYPVIEKIIILHTNDMHFDINLFKEKEAMINEIRDEYNDVFLMDAGDIVVRHPARWIVNGELMKDSAWYGSRAKEMVRSMNKLSYDVMTLGNHELTVIEPYTGQALREAHFPLLAANVEKNIKGLPGYREYVILETSTGRKLSVLGLSGNFHLDETIEKFGLLKNSSDIFMALTHIGFVNDSIMAVKHPEFDLIVGGHSHTYLKEAVRVNDVLIAQAGGCMHFVSDSHPMYLGIIELTLENGVLRDKSGKVIQLEAKAD